MRKAEKNEIEIKYSTSEKDLKKFSELYLKTMDRAKSSKKYLFPYKYHKETFDNLKNNITLFTANYKGKIIASSTFMHKYGFLHYHFSGTDKNYLHLAPNQLLLWKVALWGKEKGFKTFHLGGGLSNDPKDKLFHFKSGFSQNTSRFYTSEKIYDSILYQKLNKIKKQNKKNLNYFPNYRY